MAEENNVRNVTVDLRLIPSINEGADRLATKRTRRRSLWNLFIFNLCYLLVYTGFWSLATLESTMNSAGGLGDYSQAVIYIVSMVSCLFLPKLLIEKFGSKKIIIVSTFVCSLFMAANLYLQTAVLMSASVLFGLVNGPFVAAQTLYVDEMATRFQSTIKGNVEFVMASFFGLFMFFSENTQIWGNVISYYALSPGKHGPTNFTVHSNCGIHFRPSDNDTNSNLDPPSETERLILVGSYTSLGLLAVFIQIFFMEPLNNDKKDSQGCDVVCNRFLSALTHLKKPQQFLLVPLSIYIGMEGPFYSNEITQAYIACSWGVHHVGFVSVCFGVCGAIISLLVGPLVKCISQMAVLILVACANIASYILLFLWTPSPDSVTEYFLFAGFWGMGDAIWWSQVIALYALMFPNDREAAFSNLYFWNFLGSFLSYSYAKYFSIVVKIYILLCFLVTGMLGYLIGQLKIKCSTRREYVIITNEE